MARFTVVTQKSIPGYAWENTWHVQADDISAANSGGLALATFEATMLWDGGQVDGVRVSPWPDLGGNGFINTTLNEPGGRVLANPEPAELCLFVEIGASVGRPGRKWFRMSLDEGEVSQTAGKAILTPTAPVRDVFADALVDLQATLGVLSVELLIGSGHLTARVASGTMVINGVGLRQRDVGWYNKTPQP